MSAKMLLNETRKLIEKNTSICKNCGSNCELSTYETIGIYNDRWITFYEDIQKCAKCSVNRRNCWTEYSPNITDKEVSARLGWKDGVPSNRGVHKSKS